MSRDSATWREHLQSSTRIAPEARRQLAAEGVAGLTVLCHPDPRRVGEQAVLTGLAAGDVACLSRLEPHFAAPGGGTPRPLADPHVSRRPLRLARAADGGVRLEPDAAGSPLSVDGVVTSAPRDVSRTDLEAGGVVLLLGQRVALLLHAVLPSGKRPAAFGLVGESAALVRLRQEIARLADLDYPVLLRGESGTGKELAARALHDAGPRRGRPYVAVNVGATPAGVAAAELFGAVRGAYTGADRHRDGHFRRADGGTLFLDEIGEASADVQVLLLRALESREIQPVGAAEAVAVDVRLVSATDADLEAQIALGELRAPLYHRLSTCELELPPLRERRDDVGRLFFHFLRQELAAVGDEHRLDPGGEPWVPAELVARLARCDWPGNVRQLRNAVRQIVVASRGESELRVPAAVERLWREPSASPAAAESVAATAEAAAYRQPEDVSEPELLAALREQRWNVGKTAAALNVSRTSLYALMNRCPRVRKAGDLSREEIADASSRCQGALPAMVDLLEVSRRGLQLRMSELGLGAE